MSEDIFQRMSPGLRRVLQKAFGQPGAQPWEEVRLRAGAPLLVVSAHGDFFLDPSGNVTHLEANAWRVTREEIDKTVDLICDNSVYAHEAEISQGYITLPGGHRVGFCGKAVMRDGKVFTLTEISSLNIRLARSVPGAADGLMSWILDRKGVPYNTLVFSPPGAGKTTILRDIVRQLSRGNPDLGCKGMQVAVADERSELAGTRRGLIQHDLGPRVDVMDGCPKAIAMLNLIRGMAPQVLVTDEIGRMEDADALAEAVRCGIRVIVSAHGGSLVEVAARPMMRELLKAKVFARMVRLGRSEGSGTIEEIWDGRDATLLHPARGRSNLIRLKG